MKVTRNIFEYYINTHEIIKEIMWLFFFFLINAVIVIITIQKKHV